MNAYAKQQKTMKALGIAKISRNWSFGHTQVWNVFMLDGLLLTVNTHIFATETGVLRQCAQMLLKVEYK